MITDDEAKAIALKLAEKLIKILSTTDFEGDSFDADSGLYYISAPARKLYNTIVTALKDLISIETEDLEV